MKTKLLFLICLLCFLLPSPAEAIRIYSATSLTGGGAGALDAIDKDLLLWDDYTSVPDDWQKKPVNGQTRFCENRGGLTFRHGPSWKSNNGCIQPAGVQRQEVESVVYKC